MFESEMFPKAEKHFSVSGKPFPKRRQHFSAPRKSCSSAEIVFSTWEKISEVQRNVFNTWERIFQLLKIVSKPAKHHMRPFLFIYNTNKYRQTNFWETGI